MNFAEAAQAMRNGYFVRREKWSPVYAIGLMQDSRGDPALHHNVILVEAEMNDNRPGATTRCLLGWHPHCEDLFADDWYPVGAVFHPLPAEELVDYSKNKILQLKPYTSSWVVKK